MALVYRAVDERTGEEAALKLLADNLAADEAFRRRFLREARLAARLDHRNVVRVLDAGEHDGRPGSRWSTSRARRSPRCSRDAGGCRPPRRSRSAFSSAPACSTPTTRDSSTVT